MTLTMFNKFYKNYKDTFYLEMMLKKTGTTHAQAYKKAQDSDEWF